MFSPFLKPAALATILLLIAGTASAQSRELRVCADPDNMPFSNIQQRGFENRIAELVARDLGAHLTYVWQRMGRGFVREYIDKSQCDLVIGVPANFRPLLTTTPYYRSSYVFVVPRRSEMKSVSLNSPELHGLKIGVQVLDENYTPPGTALARRGLQSEIVGFDTTGEDAESIVRAVAKHQVDLAVVWGPLAGYFARRYRGALKLMPVEPEVDPPGLPFTFAISMGVRKGNTALRNDLQNVLSTHSSEIHDILAEYGVPELPLPPQQAGIGRGQ
jgi:mxaJ protein